jgi:hypothetical protein
LRCELVELVDHPDDLICGFDRNQGAVIHRHFLTWGSSLFNGCGDTRGNLKKKCRDPTADSI